METLIKPEIGMGATVSYAADSHAMTIIAVSQNGKTVTVQRDSVKPADHANIYRGAPTTTTFG